MLDKQHIMTKAKLVARLNKAIDQTLGDLDTKGEFASVINKPKKTGVAGNVIENSVLGYPSDSEQRPDLVVDGLPVEVKTTGIRRPKKPSKLVPYEAKESMSITAISPENIVNENYPDSSFWHKIAHLLFIYYLYDSPVTVKALGYADFPVLGYDFVKFTDSELAILKNDWELVKAFIQQVQINYEDPRDGYPLLSTNLNRELMFLDTAPKYPHRPRFRFKRDFVSSIVKRHFDPKMDELITNVHSYEDFDGLLHAASQKYVGKTIRELLDLLHIDWKQNKKADAGKNCTEQIVSAIFGSKAKAFSKVQLFNELGIKPKTLTITKSGKRTEDTKFSGLNVFSWGDERDEFTESLIYSYFADTQFLVTVFEEPSTDAKLLDNKLLGFKRFTFSDDFIDRYVRKLWTETRDLLLNGKFKDSRMFTKDGNLQITPKTKLPKTQTNLMKSKDNKVFFRGSGGDATDKDFKFNGYKTYKQQDVWIKGTTFIELLEEVPYL